MNYIELNIETGGNGVELVETELTEMGIYEYVVDDPRIDEEMAAAASGTEYVDPKELQARASRAPKVTVYLNADAEGKQTADAITERMYRLKTRVESGDYGDGVTAGSLSVDMNVRGDEEWKDKWKEFFKPAHISKRLVVCPSWEKYEKQNDSEIVIRIDPGMAFGTGTHETTMLTAQMMEKYIRESDSVLDVGCGTGILSIIANKLGAGEILGIDIEQEAIDASIENCEMNDCESEVRIQIGDLTKGVEFKANIVVANLLTPLVLMLSEAAPRHLLPGGIYITSGILVEQEQKVYDCLEGLGFEIIETAEKGDWCCIVAKMN